MEYFLMGHQGILLHSAKPANEDFYLTKEEHERRLEW